MTRDAALLTVNCTACGAGLDVFGGGRVKRHICTYCGTELDAHDNYKALKVFSDAPKPKSPLEIGMSAVLDGVEFMIIGTIGKRETYGGKTWVWAEHQLFSPTHGYAWLSVEDGHLIFSRKVRGASKTGWWDESRVNRMSSPPQATWGLNRYRYYDSGASEIDYAAGEFNWVPERGDRTTYVSFTKQGGGLRFAEAKGEREIELSTYMPRDETLALFGVKSIGWESGVHAMQPFLGWRNGKFFKVIGGIGTAACITLALMHASSARQALDPVQLRFSSLPQEVSFPVNRPGDLVEIQLRSNVDNSWAWVDLEVTDPEDQPLFEASRGVEYYHGYQDGKWTEGSRRTSLTFRADMPGEYTIGLENPEADVDWRGGKLATVWQVSAREGVKSPFWLVGAGILFLSLALAPLCAGLLHEKRRMAGSDWVDEDED